MKNIVFVLSFMVLCGCTPYQSSGFGGGYSETQLAPNVYKVSFRGNGYTDSERVADFALLRAADLGLQHGFSHFVILNNADAVNEGTIYQPPTYSCIPSGPFINCNSTGGGTTSFSKPSSENTVAYFKGKPKGFSYSCAFIKKSIGAKYDMK
jgi:hypothetical protein